jgi:hypothetical protein
MEPGGSERREKRCEEQGTYNLTQWCTLPIERDAACAEDAFAATWILTVYVRMGACMCVYVRVHVCAGACVCV